MTNLKIVNITDKICEKKQEEADHMQEIKEQIQNYHDLLAALGFTEEADIQDVRNRLANLLETEFMYTNLVE